MNTILPEKYFLSVGSIHPRKNLIFILRTLQRFWKLYPEYLSIKLVIVGAKGWQYQKLVEEINHMQLQNQVVFTGYLNDEQMPWIYHNASLFFYPSLYEGFGFPPLEAMACEVPVISSDRASLPEITSMANCCFPLESRVWIDEIIRILQDTQYREKRLDLGKLQVNQYHWSHTAKHVMNDYISLSQEINHSNDQ